ncbi:MAG TPA: PEP-CTERM-box response regulator transcription factor [Rubrivivax sp.]|jgi:two-component system NtrC family response regulator|nr:PEP-CTERM-box response regulator transcription factor [Burkholderiaceae bacterium]MCP5288064.1 PEP-CTERM-box response regulator transcription factor [Burkholderiaceae bacterium]HMQ71312.1 PEP-CTERM-box response regulator transcription factor [Rubrivivax sp.]HMR68726.1 PEP-CTERM-box response regulator transcription factor [Rubrivivax sp.]
MSADKTPPLLIVEDDLALQKQIKWSLDAFECVTAQDRTSALLALRRHQPAVVTMDLGLPPDPDSTSEGFRLLEQMLEIDAWVKVIVLTGQNEQANALRAVAMGAYDFLAKPFEPELLALIVSRAYRMWELQGENRRLQAVAHPDAMAGLTTRDPEMLKICRLIERVAGSDATVMLLGESGTGKEVLAQGLHQASRRSGKFVAINCAAIPENLLETELFGHEKGAFTGATKTTVGKIETAHGGTLMLDEIGDLPLALQAKLLRFLQERTIERVGGRQEIAVDVRVVCATHQDLKAQIVEGRFREDLYYRLAEIVVEIPPLRERNGDAVLLAHAYLRRFAHEQRRGVLAFTEDALRAIEAHRWPGNVRELINVVKRAAIMAEAGRVSAADLGLRPPEAPPPQAPVEHTDLDLRTIRERAERDAIVTALARANGNVLRAAEMLGVSRPTLYDLMGRLALR